MNTANGRKYIVVTAKNPEILMDLVNKALEAGYICQGGVAIVMEQGYHVYAQAMVNNTGLGN